MKALEKYYEKLKQNAPNSYKTYLAKQAKSEDVSYYDTLSAAKSKRAYTDADYGTDASRLLSLGMSNSGYRDYIEGSSAKSLADAMDSAESERAAGEHLARQGYESYLTDYNGIQTKISEGLIKQIAQGYDFDFERALERAVNAGLSESVAYSTAKEATSRARLNAYNEAVTFSKLNMLSAKRAKEYAKSLGLDEAYAERVYDAISIFNDKDRQFLTSMNPNQYYNYITQKAKKEKKG